MLSIVARAQKRKHNAGPPEICAATFETIREIQSCDLPLSSNMAMIPVLFGEYDTSLSKERGLDSRHCVQPAIR
jgi:hypothetical protein